jgi:aldose 1-epimerase
VKIKSSVIENKFLRIKTINLGATLYEVFHKKKKTNLILNLGSISSYKYKSLYVGAICGRFAGRIAGSKFQINKQKYYLNKNEGINTLHGGKRVLIDLFGKKLIKLKTRLFISLNPNI